MALPLSRGKNHGHGSVWKAVDRVSVGAGKWITARGVRLCLCRLRVHKKGLAEGGRQACGVHGLRVSSKWAHIGVGKKKILWISGPPCLPSYPWAHRGIPVGPGGPGSQCEARHTAGTQHLLAGQMGGWLDAGVAGWT